MLLFLSFLLRLHAKQFVQTARLRDHYLSIMNVVLPSITLTQILDKRIVSNYGNYGTKL